MRILCEGKDVVQSEGLPWNGWESYLDEDGSPIEPYSFVTGGWWDALKHLSECERCRRVNGITLREVRRRLRQIEREWRAFTDC